MSSLANFFQTRNTSLSKQQPIYANNPIQDAFSITKQNPTVASINPPIPQRQRKVKKIEQAAVDQEEEINQQQPKQDEPEDLTATVFVGNIPLTSTRKDLKIFFSTYGTILKVWFRSIPVEKGKLPKKAAHILKKYQEGADSMNAYVKFKEEKEAKAACAANGMMIEDKNIKVTMCNQFSIDYQSTIFIGNLPHSVKDQDLWDAFQHIGTIKNVRAVRDKKTMEGIGIAYVQFENKDEMRRAISQLNGKKMGDRPMRIKKAVSKDRLQKKVKKLEAKKKNKKIQKMEMNKTGKGKFLRRNNINLKDQISQKKGKPIKKDFKVRGVQRQEPKDRESPKPIQRKKTNFFVSQGKKTILA